MYNSSQKEDFIQYVLSASKTKDIETYKMSLITFFNRLEPIEEELDKDFAMFNFEEIMIVLSILCKRSVKYQGVILSRLRKYIEWAISLGKALDSENKLVGISQKDIDFYISYKMSMVKDEEQLSHYLDIVLRPMADDTIDNMYRALLHLIFNGFNMREAIDLKREQVDLEHKLVSFNNKKVDISEMCSNILRHLFLMHAYLSIAFKEVECSREIVHTGHVLERSIASRNKMVESLSNFVSLLFKKLKLELGHKISITLSDILISGIFYRIYVKECETGEIDLSEYMSRYKDHVLTIDNPELTAKDGMIEYLAWKTAFSLA